MLMIAGMDMDKFEMIIAPLNAAALHQTFYR